MKTDSAFLKTLLSLAIPIMLQNLLASSISFLDTLMIGQLGPEAIAAVGVGNQVFFLVNLFSFGIASGTSVFIARYYGAKNYLQMQRVTSLGLFITTIGGLLCILISLLFPHAIMRIFTNNDTVINLGVEYLKTVAISYIFFTITQTLSIAFRAIGKATTPLITSSISLSVNAIGNYILIFGVGPIPALGVTGAAIATVFSRLLELVILLILINKTDAPFKIKNKNAFKWNRDFLLSYLKTSLPVLCNEMIWALGITFYKIAFSKIGVEALAASSVTESISNLFFVISLGIGNASTIMIGTSLGEGNVDKTRKMSKSLMIISCFAGLFITLLMVVLTPCIPRLFNTDENLYKMITSALYVIAFFQPIKSMNMTSIVGVFRGAADTRFALYTETFSLWVIGVPLSFTAVLIFHSPLYIVYIVQHMDEMTKFIISLFRLRTSKWIKALPSQ